MSCTPCGRTVPDIIKLARTEPKLYHCSECMSVWTPEELGPERHRKRQVVRVCPEDGEELAEI